MQQGQGDHHALCLPDADFCGLALQEGRVRGQVNAVQELGHAGSQRAGILRVCSPELPKMRRQTERGIERGHCALGNKRDLPASYRTKLLLVAPQQVLPVQ